MASGRESMKLATTLCAVLIALSIGFVAGRAWSPSGTRATTLDGTPSVDMTTTRQAELQEIEQLQTQVAEQATACAPTPTPIATATPVPPAAQGESVPYVGNWTIVVTGASTATNVGDDVPSGMFVLVNMTFMNNEPDARFFEYGNLRLVDEQGRVFVDDVSVSSRVPIEHTYNAQFEPNIPTDTIVVFDAAT